MIPQTNDLREFKANPLVVRPDENDLRLCFMTNERFEPTQPKGAMTMSGTRKFNRTIIAFCLVLALGVAPGLTVYAQQPAQKQMAAQTKIPMEGSLQDKDKKAPAEEDVPLSDAEMEKVEGGNPVAIAIGVAGLALGAYSLYRSHRAHQQLLQACTAPRR